MEEVLPTTLLIIGRAICKANVQSSHEIWQVVMETAQSQLRGGISVAGPAGPSGVEVTTPSSQASGVSTVPTPESKKCGAPKAATTFSMATSKDLGATLTRLFLVTCYDVFALAKCYQESPWNIGQHLSTAQKRAIKRCNALRKLSRPILKTRAATDSSTLDDEEDDDDYCDDLPDIFDSTPPTFRRGPRGSVRADTTVSESLPVYHKDAEQRMEIEDALNTSFVFEAFGTSEDDYQENLRQRLIDALKPVQLACRSWVMREGDTGDGMYFVGRGKVEILREGKKLKVLRSGDLIGELAVLHHCKRTYSAQTATEDTLLYYLDRASYQTLLRARRSEALPVTHEHRS